MILVTVTHKQGMELAETKQLAIDPEKIVSVRTRDGHAEIDYGESYDRNRQTITYEVTAVKPNIDATITGEYSTHTYLSLTVIWADNRDLRPFSATSYALDMQEKYIVDIEDTYIYINNKTKTSVRKLRFVPGAFKEEVIYVSNHLHDLVTDTPSDTTTTTTEIPVTTTTTEPQTTTTTEQETTTTTTWNGLCFFYTLTSLERQSPAVFLVHPCDQNCDETYVMIEYGQPQVLCLCYYPTQVAGGEATIEIGDACPTTTTTTGTETTTTTTWDGICWEYTITNLDEQLPAVFQIYPCDNDCLIDFVVVEFGQPQTLCLCYEPVFIEGSQTYAVVRASICPETTTTTTEVTTTTTEIATTTTTETTTTTTELPT